MPGLTMINYEKIKKGQTGIYYPEALLFLYHLVETLVSLHLSPQYRACGSDTSPSLPSPLCIFLSFFPFSSHPPLFPCVTSIFIRQKQDLHQPACLPACLPGSPERCRSAACSDSPEEHPGYSPPRCRSERLEGNEAGSREGDKERQRNREGGGRGE